jgi:hypothetical protein
MFDKSEFHPMVRYRCSLSRVVIAQAAEWLQDKRVAAEELPQSKNSGSKEVRSLSVKIEPENDSDEEVGRRITRSQSESIPHQV